MSMNYRYEDISDRDFIILQFAKWKNEGIANIARENNKTLIELQQGLADGVFEKIPATTGTIETIRLSPKGLKLAEELALIYDL